MSQTYRIYQDEGILKKYCGINTQLNKNHHPFQRIVLKVNQDVQINLMVSTNQRLQVQEIIIHSDIFNFLCARMNSEEIYGEIITVPEPNEEEQEEEYEGEEEDEENSNSIIFTIDPECSSIFQKIDESWKRKPSLFLDHKSSSFWKENMIRRKLMNSVLISKSYIFFDFLGDPISLYCSSFNTTRISKTSKIILSNQSNDGSSPEINEFVGYENLCLEIFQKIEHVERTKISETIWLWGEQGVGKSLLLRHIQRNFRSRKKVFQLSGEQLSKTVKSKNINEIKTFESRMFSSPSLILIDDIDQFIHSIGRQKKAFEGEEEEEGDVDLNSKRMEVFIKFILDKSLRSSSFLIIVSNQPPPKWVSTKIKSTKYFPIPNQENRLKIIQHILGKKGFVFGSRKERKEIEMKLASLTPNYVARGIKELLRFAYCHFLITMKKGGSKTIDWSIFEAALTFCPPKLIGPSQHIGMAVPSLSWDDIAGYDKQKELCKRYLFGPLKYGTRYRNLGIPSTLGILLHGPSGCGKSMFVRALASFGHMNFLSIKCTDIFSMYTGETEKNISSLFQRARTFSPCVLVFDELDALCPSRNEDDGGISDSGVGRRALSQFLTELDGVESREQVFIIACTNQLDLIDSAVLRPGRMDQLVRIPLPSPEDRKQIFVKLMKRLPVLKEIVVDEEFLDEVVGWTENFSGGDLKLMCKEASWEAFQDKSSEWIEKKHFVVVMEKRKNAT